MREIKFRYWNGVTNQMVNEPKMPYKEDWTITQLFSDRGWVWMQYTGLLDKNGKEIYEGDIIEWSVYEDAQDTASGEEEKSRWKDSIYFSSGCFALEKRKELLFNFLAPHKELEIIGNIYENPTLIG